jgi:hypothetical protein
MSLPESAERPPESGAGSDPEDRPANDRAASPRRHERRDEPVPFPVSETAVSQADGAA